MAQFQIREYEEQGSKLLALAGLEKCSDRIARPCTHPLEGRRIARVSLAGSVNKEALGNSPSARSLQDGAHDLAGARRSLMTSRTCSRRRRVWTSRRAP